MTTSGVDPYLVRRQRQANGGRWDACCGCEMGPRTRRRPMTRLNLDPYAEWLKIEAALAGPLVSSLDAGLPPVPHKFTDAGKRLAEAKGAPCE